IDPSGTFLFETPAVIAMIHNQHFSSAPRNIPQRLRIIYFRSRDFMPLYSAVLKRGYCRRRLQPNRKDGPPACVKKCFRYTEATTDVAGADRRGCVTPKNGERRVQWEKAGQRDGSK